MSRRGKKAGALLIANNRIRTDGDLVSLQDIWVADGSRQWREPWGFIRLPDTLAFIDELASSDGISKAGITRQDDPNDIWAHWQVAMRYNYLIGHTWAIGANKAIKEWIEEKRNPELKARRAARAIYENAKARGVENPEFYTEQVLQAIGARVHFTEVYGSKVRDPKYGSATNACYQGLTEKKAAELRAEMGLPHDANVRSFFPLKLRMATALAEVMAAEEMAPRDDRSLSNKQGCEIVYRNASRVRLAIDPPGRGEAR